MRIIDEDVQLIHIDSSTQLTPATINMALMRASGNRMYAKFYTDEYFIQVNFAKDGTISVASNIRSSSFLQDYTRKTRQGWTMSSVKMFIYQWMQLSRSLIW